MSKGTKLTIHDLKDLTFVGEGSATSRVVRLSGEDGSHSYVVDMSGKASAAVSLSGSDRSGSVNINGAASSVVRVVSAITRNSPELVGSMALTISGAKPIGK